MINNESGFNESLPAGFDGVFEWDFLKGAFPRDIQPMDIDALVEIKGRFLAFETKAPGTPIKKGQKITLRSLANMGQGAVMYIDGKSPSTFTKFYYVDGAKLFRYANASPAKVTSKIYEVCVAWGRRADNRGKPLDDGDLIALDMEPVQ